MLRNGITSPLNLLRLQRIGGEFGLLSGNPINSSTNKEQQNVKYYANFSPASILLLLFYFLCGGTSAFFGFHRLAKIDGDKSLWTNIMTMLIGVALLVAMFVIAGLFNHLFMSCL